MNRIIRLLFTFILIVSFTGVANAEEIRSISVTVDGEAGLYAEQTSAFIYDEGDDLEIEVYIEVGNTSSEPVTLNSNYGCPIEVLDVTGNVIEEIASKGAGPSVVVPGDTTYLVASSFIKKEDAGISISDVDSIHVSLIRDQWESLMGGTPETPQYIGKVTAECDISTLFEPLSKPLHYTATGISDVDDGNIGMLAFVAGVYDTEGKLMWVNLDLVADASLIEGSTSDGLIYAGAVPPVGREWLEETGRLIGKIRAFAYSPF